MTIRGFKIKLLPRVTNAPNVADRIMWAVVVVREGYDPNTLHNTTLTDLYNPTRDVVCSSIWTTQASNSYGRAKFNRKLMIGDRLMLLVRNMDTDSTIVEGSSYMAEWTVSY